MTGMHVIIYACMYPICVVYVSVQLNRTENFCAKPREPSEQTHGRAASDVYVRIESQYVFVLCVIYAYSRRLQ
jgi:hypothetical protein